MIYESESAAIKTQELHELLTTADEYPAYLQLCSEMGIHRDNLSAIIFHRLYRYHSKQF